MTHGYDYWKVWFITKNGCSNLYINTNLYDSSGNIVGTWYQKGGQVSAMQPEELEIVAKSATDGFKITDIECN